MKMKTVEKLQGGALEGKENMWRMSADPQWDVVDIWRGWRVGGKKAYIQTLLHSYLIYPLLQSHITGERPTKRE